MLVDHHLLLKKIILILLVEKIAQHFLTALFFIHAIPGIGTPDIGSNFTFNNDAMAYFNITYGIFFVVAFNLFLKNNPYSLHLVVILSFLDIILEFLFHGIGYITVSVIICTILIILIYKEYSLKTKINSKHKKSQIEKSSKSLNYFQNDFECR